VFEHLNHHKPGTVKRPTGIRQDYLAMPNLLMKKRAEKNVCVDNDVCGIQVEPY
jgi:hypothetical protein